MTWRRLLSLVIGAALLLGWFTLLRPQFLGGGTAYVMVSGTSMQPTLAQGDVVLARRQAAYGVGDVIVFRVPEGELGAGTPVIHRVIGGSPEAGYRTQGDNRDEPDRWRPTQADVIGKQWVHLPGVGRPLGRVRDPLVAASVAGAVAMALVLSGRAPARHPAPNPVPVSGGHWRGAARAAGVVGAAVLADTLLRPRFRPRRR